MLNHATNYSRNQGQDAADESADSLAFMMEQETTTYSCGDYLSRNDSDHDDCTTCSDDGGDDAIPESSKITPNDRMTLVDWCYAIVDPCQFERDTVAVAMNIVDRFMSTTQAQDILCQRGQYQLVTVTALYIAIKMNERDTFGSEDFSGVCHGTYSVEDIEDMEWQILQALSWRLCPPTSLQVAHRILSLLLPDVLKKTTLDQGVWDFIQDEVSFQTENAVRDYYFTTQRPSTVAAAAIANAIEQVNDDDYEHLMTALIRVLKHFDFDSTSSIMKARDQLSCLVTENEESGSVDPSDTQCHDHDSRASPTDIQDTFEIEKKPTLIPNDASPKSSRRSSSRDSTDCTDRYED